MTRTSRVEVVRQRGPCGTRRPLPIRADMPSHHRIVAICSLALLAATASPAGASTADTVRAVVVARVDGTGARPTGFEFLEALALDSAGRLYTLDKGAHALDAFDASGRHRWTRGRKGKGPGEFEAAVGLAWAPSGALWVIDPENQRATVVDGSGGIVGSHVLPSSFVLSPWPGRFDRSGRLLHYTGANGPGYEYDIGVFDAAFRLTERRSPPEPPQPQAYFEGKTDRGSHMRSPVPFGPRLVWRLDSHGRFVSVWTAGASFVRSGRPLGAPRRGVEEGPLVGPIDRREAIADLERFVRMGGRVDASRIPSRKPLLDSFVLDERDRIWAVRSRMEGQRTTVFDVYDAEGRYERSVTVPARLGSFPLLVVRNGLIAGVERDADGVQTVIVARVP